MSPNSGKFAFSLRKKKEFEHRFFNQVEISPDTFAHKYLLKDIEKPELRSGSGGSIGYGNFCVELTVKDRILWDSLDRTVSEIVDFSNSIADEFDLTENFTMDYVIAKLHNFWKSGYLNFSTRNNKNIMNDLIENALKIGAQQHSRGELPDAEQTYLEALETHPDDASLNYNLALLLIEMAKDEQALRYVKNSLRSDPMQTNVGLLMLIYLLNLAS